MGAFHSSFVSTQEERPMTGFKAQRRSSVGAGATGAKTFMQSKVFQARSNNSAAIIQKHVRGMLAKQRIKTLLKETRKAIVIQKGVRGMLQRIRFKILLNCKLDLMNDELRERSVIVIQGLARGMLQRVYLMKLSAAVFIQTQFRGWRTRMHFRILVLTRYLEEVQRHPLPEVAEIREYYRLDDKKKREIIAEVKEEIALEKANPSSKKEDADDILARETVEEYSRIMAELRNHNKYLRSETTKLRSACKALSKENEKYFAKVDGYSNGMGIVEGEMPKILESNDQWSAIEDDCKGRIEQYKAAIKDRTEMIYHEEKLLTIFHSKIQSMIYMIRDRCPDKALREEIADICSAGVVTTGSRKKEDGKKDSKKKDEKVDLKIDAIDVGDDDCSHASSKSSLTDASSQSSVTVLTHD